MGDICVTLYPSPLRRTISTLHSSGFAGLDLDLFTKPAENRLFANPPTLEYGLVQVMSSPAAAFAAMGVKGALHISRAIAGIRRRRDRSDPAAKK